MHARKITSLYDMAMKMGAPVIGLIDCAGLRLQEATDALNAFGEIYLKQSLASGVIPQITAVFGTCGGGLAVVPGLSDFTFMEKEHAQLFVNSPNALDGNRKEVCTNVYLLVPERRCRTGGLYRNGGRDSGRYPSAGNHPSRQHEDDDSYEECTDDLNRVCADLANAAGDTAILLSQISDNGLFVEVKAAYAKEMVTGFIKLNGMTVGAVANRTEVYDAEGNRTDAFDSVLTVNGSLKAAEFVQFCDAFNIPVLSLTNATGFKADKHAERKIARAAAKLTYAFANATVPKVNVVIGKAFGSAYAVMNSKALGADVTYAWSQAQIGMMDAKLAAKIMYADADSTVINEKAAEYAALQESAMAAARRGYVDTIIEAEDTRKYVIGAFEMLFTKREDRPAKKHGTV